MSQGSTDLLTLMTLAAGDLNSPLPSSRRNGHGPERSGVPKHPATPAGLEQPAGHTQAGVSRIPHGYLLRMMCVMTKAKIKMVRKESDRMNM